MTTRLVLALHSSALRTVTEDEALRVLSPAEQALTRQVFPIDTSTFDAAVQGGVWDDSHEFLRRRAAELRDLADAGARVLYFGGMPEVPHAVALGAYVGDERHVEAFDPARDNGGFGWPAAEGRTLEVTADSLPEEQVARSGIAVVRVEISRSIQDADVDAVVSRERIADVRIRPSGRTPDYGIVRSAADVDEIRETLRRVLAAIAESRPGMELLHLFVAAPPSVCIGVGQELRLRNSVPVQTYRYRPQGEPPAYREAIFLTAEVAGASLPALAAEQIEAAAQIRTDVCPRVLDSVQEYARQKYETASELARPWFAYLQPGEDLRHVAPFPRLPPIWEVVHQEDRISPEPYVGEFENDLREHRWHFGDHLLTGLKKASAGDNNQLEAAIRLFLFHEYVHRHHSITLYTVEEVGKFSSCLERLDYQADLYGLLHELDFASSELGTLSSTSEKQEFIVKGIDLILRSIWSFEPAAPLHRWEIRRLRRYLNWYWRQAQVCRCPSLRTSLAIIGRAPTIDLAGLESRVAGRRVYAMLNKRDPTTELALGLVMENERLLRVTQSATTPIETELLEGFAARDHDRVRRFFDRLFEEAATRNGALPDT